MRQESKAVLYKIGLIILMSFFYWACSAQTTVDANGNYTIVTKAKVSKIPISTGKTVTDKDGTHPIYQGSKGGLYYFKINSKGDSVKAYLPKKL